ncbi:zinc metallo proteinase [Sphaerulina musiva SO2202]|uniref:Zinc metallo proteinase n=1 Tax=Sphaerulina musiva (strain SO2202) TaxID=692275 RepID=M3B880_SPHMS|nr:zinc metallo proteinase [Sphaerulina musiva SO2202]EMF16047.1 zinc metallo proteinase [Sphaerulina musiva SO2202]
MVLLTVLLASLTDAASLVLRQSDTLSSGAKRPPQAPRIFNDTAESLQEIVAGVQSREDSVVQDIITNVKPEDATFENTVVPYMQHEDQDTLFLSNVGLYTYVSQKPELRDAADNVTGQIGDITQATYLNEDLFERVNATYYKQVNDTNLSLESRNLLGSFWGQFAGTGLAVEKGEKRDRYQNASNELEDLQDAFAQALVDDKTVLWFTKDELNGTRDDTLSTLEKGTGENEGKLKVDFQIDSDLLAISTHCTNETTRKALTIASANRAPDNPERLKKAAGLRDELARLLGDANFAASVIASNLAQTPEAVHKLLDDVQAKVTPYWLKKLDHLKELKKNDTGNADHFFLWDSNFYQTMSTEQEYQVDKDKIKQYFPALSTIKALLDLYAGLFHLHFVKIEGKDRDDLSPTGKGEDITWQEDVEIYAVWNDDSYSTQTKRDEGEFVGYLYLDLYQREGKAPDEYSLSMEPGFVTKDGSRHYPLAVLVTNIKESATDTPSLFDRGDVEAILHELGHCMHQLTSRVTYGRLHGPSSTPPDFYEMPSQMMENWAYERAVLKQLSKHWSYLSDESKAAWQKQQNDTNAVQPPEQLPDDLIDEILKARNAYTSYAELLQVFFADYDLKLHELPTHEDAANLDPTEIYNKLFLDIIKIEGPEALGEGFHWGHKESTFHHIMSSYQGAYYAYHWSRIYGKDLFYTAFKADPFSAEAGGKFRKLILEPGGSGDLMQMITDFLGREPNNDAYYEDLELDKPM